ncbi:MAG: hypothetical protein PHE10_08600, partial [Kiritimatiellae bacterium]|nr:hypothetical protein [Kiritimatiellia bacterium]
VKERGKSEEGRGKEWGSIAPDGAGSMWFKRRWRGWFKGCRECGGGGAAVAVGSGSRQWAGEGEGGRRTQ